MALIPMPVGLAEPGGEGRLHTGRVQMGGIAEGIHAETGDAPAAFLRGQRGYIPFSTIIPQTSVFFKC